MTDRLNLTAEQARELNETGRVEVWTEIPGRIAAAKIKNGDLYLRKQSLLNPSICCNEELPHGPDGERWVAEAWKYVEQDDGVLGNEYVLYQDDYIDGQYKQMRKWQPAELMPREASRANANITTADEQRDGVLGLLTVVERKARGVKLKVREIDKLYIRDLKKAGKRGLLAYTLYIRYWENGATPLQIRRFVDKRTKSIKETWEGISSRIFYVGEK